MSRELIDAWLDGEIDEAGQAKLETWLQEDPAHRREFLAAAAMQEDLRSAYRQRQPLMLEASVSPWREWLVFMRRGWIPIAGMATVILVVSLFSLGPRGVDDRTQWQAGTDYPDDPSHPPVLLAANQPVTLVSGDLAIASVGAQDPGGGTSGTEVKSAKTPGVVRWGDDLALELESHTGLLLAANDVRQRPDRTSAGRVVTLTKGQVRVKQLPVEPVEEPTVTREVLEIVTPAGRIVADGAEFVVACTAAPMGTAVSVTVKTGEVKVLQGYRGKVLRIGPGETVTLPVDR